ncbi:unnamed protein product [Rotaria sp. Silwood2]|nr:unnamed protein product [Rotaria sp. Silwood2]CAF2928419.1 unnamed protein product [Rotaria sp. Silwood2]CAF3323851.1 unnamed protein product [Rotaria sp. Silwood2]CAF4110434.1 unnamed protein product [Rotaria sp. Silwood2]CAF4210476.1 unnamed protein product [Rotaria sp. Silwood2]
MGSLLSCSTRKIDARIRTKDGNELRISQKDLVEHILLLRQVIAHPEMTNDGQRLDHFINDYCERMARLEIINKDQHMHLPWEIEWIWHVHRLHPVNYSNDCTKQLSDGEILDKKVLKYLPNPEKKHDSQITSSSTKTRSSFVPSIDLREAIIHQRGFLEKFREHYLYSFNLRTMHRSEFLRLVLNYIYFMRLPHKNQTIVPTFDIDLIWRTHMRNPSQYQTFSTDSCGFILDHYDEIESNIVNNTYQKTAKRLENTSKSGYDDNVDQKRLETSEYTSLSAKVSVPIHISSANRALLYSAIEDGCESDHETGEYHEGGDFGSGGCVGRAADD